MKKVNMENLNQPYYKRSWTVMHLTAIIILFFMVCDLRSTIDMIFDKSQKMNLYWSIYQFKSEIFKLSNWLPLEFSHFGNSASKYFCFFIGEVFVNYIIINLHYGPQFAEANHQIRFDKPYQPDPSKKLYYLQIIFCLFRLARFMLFATLVSLWAYYTSFLIYKDFCRMRWKARGSKEEKTGINLMIGNTFPEEAESMAIIIFIILCFGSYGHVSSVRNFFLLIGIGTYLVGRERSMMLLIGLLSVNIPLLLLAVINPRPLSNFEESEWKQKSPKIRRCVLRDVNTDIVNIYWLLCQFVWKVMKKEMGIPETTIIVHDKVEKKACFDRKQEVERDILFQSRTHPIVTANKKRKNGMIVRKWSVNQTY